MDILRVLNNPAVKRGLGIVSVLGSAVGAVVGTLSDQKKEREWKDAMDRLSELEKIVKK